MNNHIVQTERLDFKFRSGQPILQQLNLQVPSGSIYGFLGPNGAGKTTTLRLLLSLLKKQAGTITIFGQDFQANRLPILRRIGSLIEQPSLYLHLTGKENLDVFRLTYNVPPQRVHEVLAMVRLTAATHKKVKAYSLGMKQRLAIAIALLHNPDLLILDEPTNGLDPNGIIETRELLKELHRNHGKTILVSSHLLAEIEKMATHVGIIHGGKLLFQGPLQELQELQSKRSALEITVNDALKAGKVLNGHFPLMQTAGNTLKVSFESRERTAQLNKLLVSSDIEVYELSQTDNDLENLFLQITAQ